ncbi:MAG: hypothetical protein NE327_06335 [Lentisphaeraceae bacterium]|nr:hypothetical protein [Lentisphaeraceae bacterium]
MNGAGIASGAASGAATGTAILPGWGTAIGAVAGAVMGATQKQPSGGGGGGSGGGGLMSGGFSSFSPSASIAESIFGSDPGDSSHSGGIENSTFNNNSGGIYFSTSSTWPVVIKNISLAFIGMISLAVIVKIWARPKKEKRR